MMRSRGGMTLMELVVGLTITGLMAAAGAGAFESIIDHKRVIRDASASTERAAALREMIRGWALSGNVRVQIGGGPRGLTRGVGAAAGAAAGAARGGANNPTANFGVGAVTPALASGDEMTIGNVTALNPSMQPNVTLRLYVDADPGTVEHGLTVEYQPSGQRYLSRRMLDSTIDTLRVEYLDGRTNRWVTASQAGAVAQLRAVRLTMIPNPKSKPTPSPLLTVPLLFTQGFETANNTSRP